MDTKLILVDVDGTLLDDQKKIGERTKKAISALHDHDIMFGIATGRTPYAVKGLLVQWGISDYTDVILGFNGGCFMNCETGDVVSSQMISGTNIPVILDDFKDFDFNAGIYDGAEFHSIRKEFYADGICRDNNIPLVVDGLTPYYDREIHKMLLMAKPEEITRMVDYYENNIKVNLERDYKAVQTQPHLLETFHPQLSKSIGIRTICDYYHLSREEILTFGDAMNDFEMIRDYPSVAMENGAPKVKEVANYITCSNNEDGIAVFIEEHIL